jgi:tetratricopeptide (TPR) repeat protein
MSENDESVSGRVLAMMRAGRGWLQKELAAASGYSTGQISEWERKEVPRTTLVQLAAVMGCRERTIDLLLRVLETMTPVAPGRSRLFGNGLDALISGMGDEYKASLQQIFLPGSRRWLAMLERETANDLWLVLSFMSPAARRLAVEEDKRFHRWGLAERIAEESARVAVDDEAATLELAQLSVAAAHRVQGEEGWKKRVLGLTLAFLSNAERVGGSLEEARINFDRARVLWNAGAASDPGILDESRFLELEASLRRDQRRFAESLECLAEAMTQAGADRMPRLVVKKAKTLEEMGEHEGAIELLQDVLPQIDPEAEPRLALSAGANLVVNLCAVGRAREAEPSLPELGELATRLGNGLDLVRFRWIQAKVHLVCGRRPEAILSFSRVRDDFLKRGIAYDAALVSLELALALLEDGRVAEVKEVARRLAPIFASQGIHREALAALLVFRTAADAERATATQARHILDYLRHARRDRNLRYEGGLPGPGSAS